MFTLVQLQDGCYKVVIDYHVDGFSVHKEYVFSLAESDAEPLEGGERFSLPFKTE